MGRGRRVAAAVSERAGVLDVRLLSSRLDANRRHVPAECHCLQETRLANEGLIQQIAHHLEKHPCAFTVEVRLMRPWVAVAAEQHRPKNRETLVVEFGEFADVLQGVEKFELAAFAEFSEQGLSSTPAHGAEGMEAAR